MNLDDEGQAVEIEYLEGFEIYPLIIFYVVCGAFLAFAASCAKELNFIFSCVCCCFFVLPPYALYSGALTASSNAETLSD